MTEIFDCVTRKKSTANAQAIIWVLAIVALVFWGVNVYIGKRGPMQSLTIPFFLTAVGLGIWAYWAHQRSKCTMTVFMDENKRFHIKMPVKNGDVIEVKNVSAIEPFFGYVRQPKGPDVKEVYLKLYDEKRENTLTLFQTLGAIKDAPGGFKEIEESVLRSYPKGDHVYYCKDYNDLYRLFSAAQDLEIKY